MTQLWHHAGEEGGTDPNVAWKGGFGKYGMLRRKYGLWGAVGGAGIPRWDETPSTWG